MTLLIQKGEGREAVSQKSPKVGKGECVKFAMAAETRGYFRRIAILFSLPIYNFIKSASLPSLFLVSSLIFERPLE